MKGKSKCFIILFLTISLVSSCNFLYSPIHSRENPNDRNAVITNLLAVQPQAGEVMVSFPWQESYYVYDDERIEEAMLVYSVGKAMPIRVAPLPPDSGGIFGFKFDESPAIFSESIYNLKSGEDVWFALYPKMGNKWLAPLYEKITVRDISEIPVVTGAGLFTSEYSVVMDELGWLYDTNPLAIPINGYLVLRFDLPERIRCTYASLKMNATGTNAMIYPVSSRLFANVDENERVNMIDYLNGSSFLISDATGALGADITDAVNAAIVYGSDTFVIEVDGGTATWTDTYGSESLTLDYEQY
jgi:hypothetical protein